MLVHSLTRESDKRTIDRMTTHGRLIFLMMARASDVLPEPELPAMPMMLVFAHGGE